MKQLVRFTSTWGPYNAGDLAGFDEAEARKVVSDRCGFLADADGAPLDAAPQKGGAADQEEQEQPAGFASGAAEKTAEAAGVTLEQLRAWQEPSGASGYTKPDVAAFVDVMGAAE